MVGVAGFLIAQVWVLGIASKDYVPRAQPCVQITRPSIAMLVEAAKLQKVAGEANAAPIRFNAWIVGEDHDV